MKIYCDTSFLLSVYISDANSFQAKTFLQKWATPLPITPFHWIEMRNAARLCLFRHQIDHRQLEGVLGQMEHDLDEGLLVNAFLPWAKILLETERLGSLHTSTLGIRSVDLLHVAGARILGVEQFVTFDNRQAALARLAGFKLGPAI